MKSLLKTVVAVAVATAFTVAAYAADAKQVNVGILSVESQDNLLKRWAPIIEAMKEKTGLDVKPYFASDYAGIIEAMRFDKVDVVLYGNKSAMEAVKRAGAEVFAHITELDGSPGYWSILVTHKDNDKLTSLDDVLKCDKSVNFSIGDPNSTSGFLVPTTFIFAANNVQPHECFKTVRNASHETNLLSVANKQVDVATANNRALYFRLKANFPEKAAEIKEIWRSPLIASDPLAWRANLPAEIKAKVYYFFMTFGRLGDEDTVRKERAILTNAKFGPFMPSSNAQLFPFMEMEANKQILKIKGDKKLTDAEKAAKIAEYETEIARVRALNEELPKK